jgi:demethoxyubiquinone hydroxylase (CLK1/Coq7/Cat5 family)
MSDEIVPEARMPSESPQGTLAALLTASLATALAEAVSNLVGAAYDAHIRRIEPRAHGGAEILVEFAPRPPEATLKIALGEETVEIPLPPGLVDEPAR